jgi:pimeloyl-ACP methyl ester carboxylesterase
METPITFSSDGLKLSGIVHIPEDLRSGERRPAFIILHGFGGNKSGHGQTVMAEQLTAWGYITLRIDFRGCGDSEGEHGRIICLDQVADTANAVSYMANRPDVEPDRVALVGSSFGAAVAIYAGGADPRVAAVISSGGWGDGERKFRRQHPTPEAWERFTTMLAEGRQHRERTGKSLMVPRFDIVPIPERLRRNMSAGSIMEFPAETAQSMFDFRADDMVEKISPRPLLLLHSANDSVTPTHESIELFKRAKQPAELYLLSDVDHFMFNQENPRVTRLVAEWLARFFPVQKPRG